MRTATCVAVHVDSTTTTATASGGDDVLPRAGRKALDSRAPPSGIGTRAAI